MDLIRLFYNTMDIEPSVLLHHFSRFLGFYIEANTKESESLGIDSLVDIYVIGDRFAKDERLVVDIENEEKSILILKNGWSASGLGLRTINYEDDMDMRWFLHELVDELANVLIGNETLSPRILQMGYDWIRTMHHIADAYAEVNLLEASLFSRCFYKQEDLYHWSMKKYKRFINRIEDYATVSENSDLLRYVLLYVKYEVDLVCKNNNLKSLYNSEMLLLECEELLDRYEENEELHLIRADILYELQGKWLDAAECYLDYETKHCGYAYYKCGKVLRSEVREYDDAIWLLNNAINYNKDYYQAWYQLAETHFGKKEYHEAIKCFERITDILREKFLEHILSPWELEYLYKAFLRIATIYKTCLSDNATAYRYGEYAEQIAEQKAIDKYVKIMLKDKSEIKNIIKIIYDAVQEHVSIKLKQIY